MVRSTSGWDHAERPRGPGGCDGCLLRSTPLLTATLSLALVAAGCGGTAAPSPTTSAAGSVELSVTPSATAEATAGETAGGVATGTLACDLVTPDIIATALGVTVAVGTQETLDQGSSTCDFQDAGILVRVFPARDVSFLGGMKNAFADAMDVPGVGDGAWYSSGNATFMVAKGTTVVLIQAPNQNDQTKLAALAAAIAAKL